MKLRIFSTICVVGCHLGMLTSKGAVLLDSFTDGSFAVSDQVGMSVTSLTFHEIADSRDTYYTGLESYAYMTQIGSQGTLNLRMELRGDPLPQRPGLFRLSYTNTNFSPLNLLGLDYAAITISSISGVGEFRLVTGAGPESELFPITSIGTYLIPIPYNDAVVPRETIKWFNLEVLGRTAEFAVTLDEISLVPEPSSGLLIIWSIGTLGLAHRRRVN